MKSVLIVGALTAAAAASASVAITVQPDSGRRAISPWIYGRNNNLSDDSANPVSGTKLALYRAAGLKMLRENGGNNSTKYNWRRKLSSHPDWYNNVYSHDWGYSARILQDSLPGTQGLYAFQLLGYAASNTDNNWGDWDWHQKYGFYPAVSLDLAGGGSVSTSGALISKGDPSKYLMAWPADSSTGILTNWFGTGGLGLDSTRFRYWNMDNEPACWTGTHNDVDSTTGLLGKILTPEDYVQRYIAVAAAARARMPSVKLVGPVSANEWQWYNWPTGNITYKNSNYCWPEYFIKRLGEHKDSTGVQLLDVYDIHYYPGSDAPTIAKQLQLHRIYWDTAWTYYKPNGVYNVGGSWNTSVSSEHIFARVQKWLDSYLGSGNGVTFSVTEIGQLSDTSSASATAVWYASQLGTFADHGGEIFTPWDWYSGMWETMHLFTSYAKSIRVQSISSIDTLVSAYSSVNAAGDSLTVILVNRDVSNSQTAAVSLKNFTAATSAATYQLSGLSGETFTATSSALQSGSVNVSSNSFSLSLPKLSVTAVTLKSSGAVGIAASTPASALAVRRSGSLLTVSGLDAEAPVALYDVTGRLLRQGTAVAGSLELSLSGLPAGNLLVRAGSRTASVLWMP